MPLSVLLVAAVWLLSVPPSSAQMKNMPQVVFDSGTPPAQGGTNGYSVNSEQKLAFRFFNNIVGALDHLELWFMTNTGEDQQPTISVRLHEGSETLPTVNGSLQPAMESWSDVTVETAGWAPVLIWLNSSEPHPNLDHSKFYWVVATSEAPARADPVWAQSNTRAFGCLANDIGSGDMKWQPGGFIQGAACKVVVANNPTPVLRHPVSTSRAVP